MGSDLAASNLDNNQPYLIVDNVSWTKTNYTLKSGADVRKLYENATTTNWPFGSMTFTSDIAGDAAAAYMLGFPRTSLPRKVCRPPRLASGGCHARTGD
jgi:hypothetical protein